jgi:hypothetical protein
VLTLVSYISNILPLGVSHVAQVGEDDESREEARERIDRRGDQAVSARLTGPWVDQAVPAR